MVSRLVTTVLLLSALAAPAWALHSEEERFTDNTAYTLQDKEIRLGLWRVEWGAIEGVTLGTVTVPWLLKTPNLNVKWAFWRGDPLTASAKLSVMRLDLRNLFPESPPATLVIIPFELLGSYRFNRTHTMSGGLAHTLVRLSGSTPDSKDLQGAAAVSNTQLVGAWEWRFSKSLALVTEVRLLLNQTVSESTSITFEVPPNYEVELVQAGQTDAADFKGASSVVPSLLWSWDWFNLRLGLGWGNFNLPPANFVLPMEIPIPELDLFARF